MTEYFDKNGKKIEAGMTIVHNNGDEDLVYASDNGDLGVNASNENYAGYHALNQKIYPLHQFDLSEWTVKE